MSDFKVPLGTALGKRNDAWIVERQLPDGGVLSWNLLHMPVLREQVELAMFDPSSGQYSWRGKPSLNKYPASGGSDPGVYTQSTVQVPSFYREVPSDSLNFSELASNFKEHTDKASGLYSLELQEKIKTKDPVGFKNQTLHLLRAAEDTLSKMRGLQVYAGDTEEKITVQRLIEEVNSMEHTLQVLKQRITGDASVQKKRMFNQPSTSIIEDAENDIKLTKFMYNNPYAWAAWVGTQEQKPQKYITQNGLTPAGVALTKDKAPKIPVPNPVDVQRQKQFDKLNNETKKFLEVTTSLDSSNITQFKELMKRGYKLNKCKDRSSMRKKLKKSMDLLYTKYEEPVVALPPF